MSYLNVVSLSTAKEYLGVDDNSRDAEISRIVAAAFQYLERVTNIHVVPKDRTYPIVNGCARVYDYPLNTSEFPNSSTLTVKNTFSLIEDNELSLITLNVGYDGNVPEEVVEVGLNIIETLFEGQSLKDLPAFVSEMLHDLKRHII